jgi:hypothetical protein
LELGAKQYDNGAADLPWLERWLEPKPASVYMNLGKLAEAEDELIRVVKLDKPSAIRAS